MNARGIKPIRRLINMFGALAYSLLIFTYAVIVGVGLLWLARSGLLMQLGVSLRVQMIRRLDFLDL